MLDKSKLLVELYKVVDQLFVDKSHVHTYIQDIWRIICADPSFIYKVREVCNPPWPVPLWEADLGQVISVVPSLSERIVLSVDGSQIYPDRHMIAACCLINTGSVVLPYKLNGAKVELYSTPTVCAGLDDNDMPYTVDSVNCKRQELELQEGLNVAKRTKNTYQNVPLLLLFDGSLIFWHLSSKEIEVRNMFLHEYCALLDQLHHEKIVTAWYISAPKSKELINLIRLYLCDFDPDQKELYAMTDSMTDTVIMEFYLQPYTRSIVFQNRSSVSNFYPAHVRPYFFYIHTGNEIGRVEIPAWIAQDEALVDFVAQITIDQCIKGGGYPVALAEAHEQAVVKGPDRDFFYHFLQKMIIERGQSVVASRKSMKKRGMGI